ncbi:MAG: hypothetical protein TYPL_4300 [Candidatus Tyloplasma litorale]|nr:MAG: hypothetical protein TYPL_4300 [Mycoplasmatales bacterium]
MNITKTFLEYQTRSGGVTSSSSDWTDWMYLVIGFIFLIICIWLLWYYFTHKQEMRNLKDSTNHRSAGSFVGFWGRYKASILVFLAIVFLILLISFLLMGFFGYEPDNGLDYQFYLISF